MGQEVILLPLFDYKGRIFSETDLATNLKSEYTYDSLCRVTNRKIINLADNTETNESYSYDANGNISTSTVSTAEDIFVYDDSNRLVEYNGQAVTYDLDGNMLSANGMSLTYDSANRLISAGNNSYTYDVENTRVKNLCNGVETVYTYNTNAELSQLLVKTTESIVTKYVYGNGLIGEETAETFKTYHFDYRGSTVAITDSTGTVTDTFSYDSYGNLTSRTGTSDIIFLYNGEYGVVTDNNGLLYMRARYYSPELRRFINADILMGDINNSSTLNRYAYANCNPISNIDPFGLAADESRGGATEYAHTALDAAGLIPGFGMIFDGVNVVWYLFEGDWANAGFSALAFVPLIGDVAGVGKTGYKGVKISAKIIDGINDVSDATKTIETLGDVSEATVKIHGNSLKTQKHTFGYAIKKYGSEEIMKYGETTRGIKRYSNKFYEENKVYMDILEEGSKYDMHYWQHEQIIDYYNKNGQRPPWNKSFW